MWNTRTKVDTCADLLEGACELVRRGWSQHADARAADGAGVQPWDANAVSWSLLGALVATLEEGSELGRELPLEQLATALDELARVMDDDSLSAWNDAPARTHDDVVAALHASATAAGRRLAEER